MSSSFQPKWLLLPSYTLSPISFKIMGNFCSLALNVLLERGESFPKLITSQGMSLRAEPPYATPVPGKGRLGCRLGWVEVSCPALPH